MSNYKHIEHFQKLAPKKPGVYFFKNEKETLYIGKAKNLSQRLRSHLLNPKTRGKEKLLLKTSEIDWIETSNEWEALLLEQKLIKEQKPLFNIRLRNGKKYPYVALSLDEEYPKLYITREKHLAERKYFGPYEYGYAKKLIDNLHKIFLIRSCQGTTPGRNSGSPCLDFFIHRCSAPCAQKISKENYDQSVNDLISFMNGNKKDIKTKLEEKMFLLSSQQKFEQAALWRNKLKTVTDMEITASFSGQADIIGVSQTEKETHAVVLSVNEGFIQDRKVFVFENTEEEFMEQFILQFYSEHSIPSIVICREENFNNHKTIKNFFDTPLNFKFPRKGKLLELLETAENNAYHCSQKNALKHVPNKTNRLEKLEKFFQQKLNRIECYDISHLAGEHTVGAMVVFENGIKKPNHYRRFKLEDQNNDFVSLQNMLYRRQKNFYTEKDGSFASKPDLILIDGGKGQLSSVAKIIKPFLKENILLLSIAKKEELFYCLESDKPLKLEKNDPESLLLQEIRDETHKYAVEYNRLKKQKSFLVSSFDNLPSVGPKRKKVLLEHFKTYENLEKASLEEIKTVISDKSAETIYNFINEK